MPVSSRCGTSAANHGPSCTAKRSRAQQGTAVRNRDENELTHKPCSNKCVIAPAAHELRCDAMTLALRCAALCRAVAARTDPHSERLCNSKMRHILRPEWFEMATEADLSSAVHLAGLAVELGQHDLEGRHRVRHRQLELQVELVLDHLVDVPALAGPSEEERRHTRRKQ